MKSQNLNYSQTSLTKYKNFKILKTYLVIVRKSLKNSFEILFPEKKLLKYKSTFNIFKIKQKYIFSFQKSLNIE